MNAEGLACFKAAVDEIFTRWTGFKLAVEHMGGRDGQKVSQPNVNKFIQRTNNNGLSSELLQTAIDMKNWFYEFCTHNENISEGEITDLLVECMDDEFETVLEDNSPNEVSINLVRQLHRCLKGQLDEVRADFAHLPPIARWLEPGAQVNNFQEDTESEDDDDEDMDQDGGEVGGAPQQNGNRNAGSMVQQMDEDGWTTVRRRAR